MVSDEVDQEVTRLIPRAFDRRELHALLVSPITDFKTLDRISKVLHNRLIRRLSKGFDITPPMVVRALNQPGNTPEVAQVLQMFLVSFLFREHMGPLARSARHQPIEGLARQKDDVGTVCAYFVQDEAANGASTHMHFLRGALAYKRNDLQNAYIHFDLARRMFVAGAPAYHHQVGVLSVRPMAQLEEWIAQGPRAARPLEFGSDQRFDNGLPILMAGFDAVYHDRYAARLLETGAGRVNFHFHVANPAGAELIAHPSVRYSFEQVADATPAYYSAMRFLHLEQVLRHYDRPILTVDADAVIAESSQPLFDGAQDHDIVLRVIDNFRSIVPWRHVIAQLFLCQPNDAACSYLRAFRAQFDGLVAEDGRPHWWVDQALMASSMHLLQRLGRPVRLSDGATGASSGVHQSKIHD